MTQENLRTTLRSVKIALVIIQVVIVALLIKYALLDFSGTVTSPKEDLPFEAWYGNWGAVVTTSIFFLIFLFFLTRPRKPKEWRGAGLSAAFFISLFTEMFGIPLTIYLLAPLLGVDPKLFGMYESHLWAYLLARAGIMPLTAGVHLVMVVSTILLVLGFSFLALGWRKVYRGQGELVTTGLYAKLRHPQYLGFNSHGGRVSDHVADSFWHHFLSAGISSWRERKIASLREHSVRISGATEIRYLRLFLPFGTRI